MTRQQTQLRAGIIGSGFMAKVHSGAIRSAGHSVVGLATSSYSRAVDAAGRLAIPTGYESAEALIASDVDVIHICTPNGTHAAYAIAALEAGKDVVCEKPLATSVDDALAIADAVRRSGRRLAIPFVYRYHPMAREAANRVRRGDTGPLHSITASYLQDWLQAPADDDWRTSANLGGPSRAFADIGSHTADLIEYISGERITSVHAMTKTVFGSRGTTQEVQNEDLVSVQFRTTSGAVGTMLVSQVAAGFKNQLTVTVMGSEQSISFEQERPDTLWLGERAENRILSRDPAVLTPDAAALSVVPAGHPMGYQEAFAAFVGDAYRSFMGADVRLLPDISDGVRSAALVHAVLESARAGRWVPVDDTAATALLTTAASHSPTVSELSSSRTSS